MEPSIWRTIVQFIKDSYLVRVKESFLGICMGFSISNNLLFSGELANLVTAGWWICKGLGSLTLAFITSMLTSYGAFLVKKWTEAPEEKKNKSRRKKAA